MRFKYVNCYLLIFFTLALSACSLGGGVEEMLEVIKSQSQNPAADDYNIDNLTQTLGNVTNITITPKDGKSSGAITIYTRAQQRFPQHPEPIL